jgi:2-C-methyl-D-erythritol 4-phosphate cytidylyltransferase
MSQGVDLAMTVEDKKKYAIIVAGGIGTRMGSDIPKQFLLLEHQPVLMHTIARFYDAIPDIHIVLVLPIFQMDYWSELVHSYSFSIPHDVVAGGTTRFQSVRHGLDSIPHDCVGLVAIHDGVRPLVSSSLIATSYTEADAHGSAIAAVALKDSIRERLDDSATVHRDRALYMAIQTPQTFRIDEIQKAFLVEESSLFTDDASVYEYTYSHGVHLITGEYQNIKITTPEDMIVAAALMKIVK